MRATSPRNEHAPAGELKKGSGDTTSESKRNGARISSCDDLGWQVMPKLACIQSSPLAQGSSNGHARHDSKETLNFPQQSRRPAARLRAFPYTPEVVRAGEIRRRRDGTTLLAYLGGHVVSRDPFAHRQKHLPGGSRTKQHVEMSPVLQHAVADISRPRRARGEFDTRRPRDAGFVDIPAGKSQDRHV